MLGTDWNGVEFVTDTYHNMCEQMFSLVHFGVSELSLRFFIIICTYIM